MPNPHGTPIWYELVTADPAASKTFYDAVVGWTIEAKPTGEMDYRMIATADGDMAGGMMTLTEEMTAGGARPGWLFYVGVDDVDATADAAKAAGGGVIMPPWTIEGIGRMTLLHDPQGVPFYAMRGASEEDSTAFAAASVGKCGWNELISDDQAGALDFYARLFGWTYPDRMLMGPMGDYVFIDAAGQRIGAMMQRPAESTAGWGFYFRVADIAAAAEQVTAGGGAVLHGPAEVPGGDRIVIAHDPAGVRVGLVGPGGAA
ncbi:MAG: VOC family protein [Sphingomonas sp.]